MWLQRLGAPLQSPQPRQQLLLRSDGGTVTDAALAAVRSCTVATDLLVKSKLGLDETVLPPMLRVLAYALLPALKRALTDVAGRLDGIEVVCDDNKSVKKSKRMVAKMVSEIAREEAERRAQDDRWQPVSASVRDVRGAVWSFKAVDVRSPADIHTGAARDARVPGPAGHVRRLRGARRRRQI